MKENLELASRLRDVLREVETENPRKKLKKIIDELDPPMFPAPVDGIEIKPLTNFFKEGLERQFDIVKLVTSGTYSIGTLYWNYHEGWFEFKSIGTRWLEVMPSEKACEMIKDFCKKLEKVYREKDGSDGYC